MTKRLALIDESGVFRMHWHATEHEDVGAAFRRTVSQVTSLVAGYDLVAICIDCPPYKRKELWPEYKAHREKAPEVMHEQHRMTIEALGRDYHVLGADGYEADDIIATMVQWARAADIGVDVYSSDKDLMQLIGEGVDVISVATGETYDAKAVKAKFGVEPHQIPDLLALWGDKSDGIPGIKGVGVKTASTWLAMYGDLAGVLKNVGELSPPRFQGPILAHDADLIIWRKLTELDAHAPIKPEIVMEAKEPPAPEKTAEPTEDETAELFDTPSAAATEPARAAEQQTASAPAATVVTLEKPAKPEPSTLLEEVLAATPYDRELEPRNVAQAWGTAKMLYESKCFGDWPNQQSIMAAIMMGRTLGLDAVAAVRGMHYIKGKIGLDAGLLRGLCQRHPACRYFRMISSDDKVAVFETWRDGDPEPTQLKYTMEMAERAGLVRGGGGYKNHPEDQLRARCSSKLARVVYADVCAGLYVREEME